MLPPAGVPDAVVVRVVRKLLPTAVLEVARDQLVELLLGRDVAGMSRMVADPVVVAGVVPNTASTVRSNIYIGISQYK